MSELKKTLFGVPKLDCPSEERIIRMAFENDDAIRKMEFDLEARQLKVYHSGETFELLEKLESSSHSKCIQCTNSKSTRSFWIATEVNYCQS